MTIDVAVLTVSDSASTGKRQDISGPKLRELLEESGKYRVVVDVVPDEKEHIISYLTSHSLNYNVIITTGGTGFAPRDVTPEATLAVIDRRCTGLEVALHSRSLQATPMAALSRAVAGIRGRCLIVNMPGSPKAVKECWEVLEPILEHAVNLLRDTDDGRLHAKMQQ